MAEESIERRLVGGKWSTVARDESDGGGGGTAADVAFTPTGTVAATNVQAAIAEVAAEAAVLTATVPLDNTQIKNLSTGVAPFATAVAAPGLGKAVIPIFWTARAHVVTGYTNRDPSSSLYLALGDGFTDMAVHIDAAPLLDAANDALACVGVPFITGIEVSPYLENQPLYVLLNSNSGALTGGNAANTLSVTLVYIIVDV